MIRYLAILILAIGQLPLGLIPGGQRSEFGQVGCSVAAEAPSCCGFEDVSGDSCPMSGGPCECSISPGPQPQPAPLAPLSKTERDSLTAVRPPSIGIQALVEREAGCAPSSAVSLNLLVGLTHNEVQALLGIWRI